MMYFTNSGFTSITHKGTSYVVSTSSVTTSYSNPTFFLGYTHSGATSSGTSFSASSMITDILSFLGTADTVLQGGFLSGTFVTVSPELRLTSSSVATSTTEVTDASPTYTTCVEISLTSTTEVTTASPTYTTEVTSVYTSTTEITDASPTYTTCVEESITDASPTYTQCLTYTDYVTYTDCSTYEDTVTYTTYHSLTLGALSSGTCSVAWIS